MGRFDADDTEYHGEDAGCSLCRAGGDAPGAGERLDWHGAKFCVIHDNPDIGEGTWFTAWGESIPGGDDAVQPDQGDASS